MIQSVNWCFTDFELLDWNNIFDSAQFRYLCWGKEICPNSGREHYQGWLQFKKKKRMNGVKKILGSKKIHVEVCQGSESDNEKYCKKDGKYHTLGEYITKGHRSDLDNIKKVLRNGAPIKEIMEENFDLYCRYRNGIKDFHNECAKVNTKKFRKVKVVVYWGKTGTGKTRKAMEKADFKITGDSLQWWDGYCGEKSILIDEYDSQIKCTELLNILDGYQLRLPIKGGFTYANWDKVYITSNIDPNDWHSCAKDEHRNALLRRISKSYRLT